MALAHDSGICIRAWDWSETSQTLWLFTRERGLLRCVAKGSKRTNAAFSGGIELLTRGDLVVSTRALEKESQSMCTLTAWDLAEVFPGCRASLTSFHVAMAMADLIQHGLTEHDPHEELFDALVVALRALAGTTSDELALAAFAWSVLEQTGHAPRLDHDVRSDKPLAPATSFAFAPRLGGFTSDDVLTDRAEQLPGGANKDTGQTWRVRDATLQLLRRIESAWHARARTTPADTNDAEASSRGITAAWAQLAPMISQQANETATQRASRLLLRYFREVFACEAKAIAQLLALWERGMER